MEKMSLGIQPLRTLLVTHLKKKKESNEKGN